MELKRKLMKIKLSDWYQLLLIVSLFLFWTSVLSDQKSTIKSLEAGAANQQGRTRFTLRMMVRPGYCQRGGEVGVAEPAALPAEQPLAVGGGR